MTYSINYFLEALRGLVIAAGWYVLFYHGYLVRRRHIQGGRPASKLRRILLLVSFPTGYTAWRVYILTGVRGNSDTQIFWVAILLLFALLCGDLRKPRTLRDPVFTAIYYIGMEAIMDTGRNFITRYIRGVGFPLFSPAYYMVFILL